MRLLQTTLLSIIVSSIVVSCTKKKTGLILPHGGFEFKIEQRNFKKVNGFTGSVSINLDDITKGQVKTSVKDSNTVLLEHRFKEGDSKAFVFQGKTYYIACKELENNLIGTDYGYFIVAKEPIDLTDERYAKSSDMSAKNQHDKIYELIKLVKNSEVTFLRNGSQHTGKEAAKHLKRKFRQVKDEIKTIDDFIVNIGSKSSTTGEEYKVKFPNGEEISSQKWLTELKDKL